MLRSIQPDIVVLAAAVSDFAPKEESVSKISSNGEVTLILKTLPKLIATVRDIVPNAVICGFKCLDHASTQELIDASLKQIRSCRVDLVVANNWNTIKDDNHSIVVVRDNILDQYHYYRRGWGYDDLSECVVRECLMAYKDKKAS
jgi:phosphopantothenoylcysteine decarboxylase/phosphopantothenate--cysteine ligase